MNFDEYLSIPALSSSGVKNILKSPAHFKLGFSSISFASDKIGSAAHELALEGKKLIVPGIDLPRNSKDNRKKWQEFYATLGADIDTSKPAATWDSELLKQTGIYVGSSAEVAEVEGIAESIKRAAPEIDSMPMKEHSVLFDMFGAKFKCRYDVACQERRLILDVKTCQDASPAGFASAVRKYKYNVQDFIYRSGFLAEFGEWPIFKFVAVEKKAPYMHAVYTLDRNSMGIAEAEVERASEIYLQCTERGEWPGYESNIELSPFGESKHEGGSVDCLDDLMV